MPSLFEGHQGSTGVVPQAHGQSLYQHDLVVRGLCTGQLRDHVLNDVAEGGLNALHGLEHLDDQGNGTDGFKLVLFNLSVMENARYHIEHDVHRRAETFEVRLQEMLWVLLHEVDQGYTSLEYELVENTSIVIVQICDDEEELPHSGGDLILIVKELT